MSNLQNKIQVLLNETANQILALVANASYSEVMAFQTQVKVPVIKVKRGPKPGSTRREPVTTDTLHELLTANPEGLQAGAIRSKLKLSQSQFLTLMKKARAEGTVNATGNRRTTVYTLPVAAKPRIERLPVYELDTEEDKPAVVRRGRTMVHHAPENARGDQQ